MTLELTERVLKNIWLHTQYLNEYINLLLGNQSEDDFRKESEKFVRDHDEYTDSEIRDIVTYLKSLLGEDINIADIAVVANICIDRLFEVFGGALNGNDLSPSI